MSNMKIGLVLRNMRLKQGRTMQEIANSCGLSKSMISKIETDLVFPTVATLSRIANALGTNVSSILEEDSDFSEIVISQNKAEMGIIHTERGYGIYPFAASFKKKKMQPFLFLVKKGEVKEHHVTHEGEEFIYILEGTIKFQIGNAEYLLNEGDAFYFNAHKPHQVIPVSDLAKYLDIFV